MNPRPVVPRLSVVALDTPEPRVLAEFYARLTGWPIDEEYGDDGWVQLRAEGPVTIACQHASGHRPPDWPGDEHPQQVHLDFDVDDLDEGEGRVLAIGARKAGFQPGGASFRVYLDPAGHPFCLVCES